MVVANFCFWLGLWTTEEGKKNPTLSEINWLERDKDISFTEAAVSAYGKNYFGIFLCWYFVDALKSALPFALAWKLCHNVIVIYTQASVQ